MGSGIRPTCWPAWSCPGSDRMPLGELKQFHARLAGHRDWHPRRHVDRLRLVFGLLLPRLRPIPTPLAWGGVLMPLLWTAVSFGLMGVVNPLLQERVDWPWFIVSQFVFGVVAAIVVRPLGEGLHPARGSWTGPPGQISSTGSGGGSVMIERRMRRSERARRGRTARLGLALCSRSCRWAATRSSGPRPRTGPCRPIRSSTSTSSVQGELRRLPRGRREARPGASAQRSDLSGDRARCGRVGPDHRRTAGDADAGLRPEQGRAADRRPGESARRRDQAALGARARKCAEPCRRTQSAATTRPADKERGLKVFRPRLRLVPWTQRRGRRREGRRDPRPGFPGADQRSGLRRYAITGRPDLGCRTSPTRTGRASDFQPLTSAEIADLVALSRTGDERSSPGRPGSSRSKTAAR